MAVQNKVVSINRIRAGAYDGASQTERALSWNADAPGSANTQLLPQLNTLRNRSRSAYRNHPYIFKAINTLVSDEIGEGIMPRSTSANKIELNAYWKEVSKHFDPEGVLDFSGMLTVMAVGKRVSGEIFIRKRIRRGAGYGSPLQLQVLESEFLSEALNKSLPNGNRVVGGIEFNKRGQRVAYYFYTEHPGGNGNSWQFNQKTVRIRARDVIHYYAPKRVGMVRGEPDASQSLLKTYSLEAYSLAESARKAAKSSYTGIITRNPEVFSLDEDETLVEQGATQIQPNSMLELLPGEDATLMEGDNAGTGFDLYMDETLRSIAAGFEIPFELLTGNWSNVNDRLVRAINNSYRRRIKTEQALTINQVCNTVWQWLMEASVLTGFRDVSMDEATQVEWIPSAWNYENPVQDVQARLMEVDGGLRSRSSVVAERGLDIEEVDAARREDKDREESLDLTQGKPEAASATGNPANSNAPSKPSKPTR